MRRLCFSLFLSCSSDDDELRGFFSEIRLLLEISESRRRRRRGVLFCSLSLVFFFFFDFLRDLFSCLFSFTRTQREDDFLVFADKIFIKINLHSIHSHHTRFEEEEEEYSKDGDDDGESERWL